MWETVRDDVLRSHPWNCAIKRVALSNDATTPSFDYSYQFTLPSDWIRTLQVGEYGAESYYKCEGRKILSNESSLSLVYVYRNEDVSTWDSSLCNAMTYAMSAAICYAITQSASMAQVMEQKLSFYMKRARAIDGQDDLPETMGDFPLYGSRFGTLF